MESARQKSTHKKLAELLEITTARLQSGATQPIDLGPVEPDRAEELERLVPLLRLLQQLGTEPSNDVSGKVDPAGAVLDDFRIVREIGRGGMGIVYEAQQISLDRRVALKVLPSTLFAKPKQLRRFQNEARAAASLDHPHIVPVFSNGSVGRIYYYTMLLITGYSLEELIEMRRYRAAEPQFVNAVVGEGSTEVGDLTSIPIFRGTSEQHSRQVAQLGIQVADALGHAHQRGIDHRDIKPSNLLVTADGHVWVTDFGLAHITGESSLTRTGDLLGTLRYMPPEQVLANSLIVDHRADLYSLGATMYEMLTLQPAFPARRRGLLLQQIADHAPRAPRRIDRSIPRDLETIVLQAMAERPEDRYETAGELSADLRRFLDRQPIVARRRSLLYRTAKIAYRHPPPLVATLAVFALLISILVAAAILAPRRTAMLPADQVREHQVADTTPSRHAMIPVRQGADSDVRNALRVVDRMLQTVDEDLVGVAATSHIRRALLEDALKYYKEFTRAKPADAANWQPLAQAFIRMGAIQHRLGRNSESTEDYRDAQQLLQQLVQRQPADPGVRMELATVLNDLAHVCLELSGHSDIAEQLICQRISLLDELTAEFGEQPRYRCELACAFADHGNVLTEIGRLKEAEEQFRRSLDLWESGIEATDIATQVETGRAYAHQGYGELLMSTLRITEARPHLEVAHKLCSSLASDGNSERQHELAHAQQDLASSLCKSGDRIAAERYLRGSILICEQLTGDYPETVDYAYRLAICHYDLYRLLLAQGRHEEALQALRFSSLSLEDIADDTAGAMKYVAPLSNNLYISGMRAYFRNNVTEAGEYFRRVALLLETGIGKNPEGVDLGSQLAWFLATCPDPQFQNADRAMTLARLAVEHEPEDPRHWLALGAACYRADEWTASHMALEKVQQLRNGGDRPHWLLMSLVHARLGQPQEANDWYRRALDWGKQHTCDSEQIAALQFEATQVIGAISPAVVQ